MKRSLATGMICDIFPTYPALYDLDFRLGYLVRPTTDFRLISGEWLHERKPREPGSIATVSNESGIGLYSSERHLKQRPDKRQEIRRILKML